MSAGETPLPEEFTILEITVPRGELDHVVALTGAFPPRQPAVPASVNGPGGVRTASSLQKSPPSR